MLFLKVVGLVAATLSLCRGVALPENQDSSIDPKAIDASGTSAVTQPAIALCGEVGSADYNGWGRRFSEYQGNNTHVTRIVGWSGNWYAHWVLYGLDLTYSDGRGAMVGQGTGNPTHVCDLGDERILQAYIYYWGGRDVLGLRLITTRQMCDIGAVGAGDAQVLQCSGRQIGSGRLSGLQGRVDPPIYSLGLGFLQ